MSTHASSYEEEEDDFIKVIEKEDSEAMEFPKEEDGTVLLRTIQTQFADAIGLKYKGPSGAWRAVREVDNALVAPKGGWGDQIYSVTFNEAKKRKGDSASSDRDTKYTRTVVDPLQKDLAVIGLPYATTNGELKKYFEDKYGEVAYCQIKFDRATGKSRGFGFIRFKDELAAKEALNGEDSMNGRKIQVRPKRVKPMKMYVNALPDGTTKEDLIEYFSQFGEITDAYVPQPFRSFAFFTFASTDDGNNCLRQQHVFRGRQLKVRIREEKQPAGDGSFGNTAGGGGFISDAARGGFISDAGHGGFRNSYGGYQGRNMPSQPPAQGNASADLKNMLLQFLAS